MPDLVQYQITGSTAREIASSAETAIREGLLESGQVLPTVRALANALGTSPATVNSAYRILRTRGLVITDGRRGTRVARRPALRALVPARERATLASAGEVPPGVRDLTAGLPDPALLPPLRPALARIDLERKLRMSELEAPDPDLLELAGAAFEADGIPAEALAVVGGAFDGIERVLGVHLRPGDRVIVEDPAYTSSLDLLLALGLIAVPVPVDDFGFLPKPFEAALATDVKAALLVPRAQNPLGAALDSERATSLRAQLERRPDVLVVEDDHAGIVSGAPFVTLTGPSTERWALIRSTSKFFHPDLRLALVAGDETTIARVEGRQALGPRHVSHVLQATVAELFRDPGFERTARHAADVYTARRQAMLEALAGEGVAAHGRSGLNVWVPVREEGPVVRALLDAGWLVLAGESFRIETGPGIRITIARLRPEDAGEVAQAIAAVERAARSRRAY